MPSERVRRASDDVSRDLLRRMARVGLAGTGVLVILLGIAVAPLPGPGGIPVIVVGLMLILRNSYKARRQFVKFQHAHPRLVSPIRRLLRRDPEFLALFWQQLLRIERMILPKRMRFAAKSRRSFRRRPGIA